MLYAALESRPVVKLGFRQEVVNSVHTGKTRGVNSPGPISLKDQRTT